MGTSVIQRSFAAGEIAPALSVRADLVKYVTGLRTCRNFLVRREGGVDNRPGTRFINACKTTSITVKLGRYVSEVAGESVLLEIGNGYIRFYQNGALVQLDPATVTAYDAGTTYAIGQLVASGGVVYYAVKAGVGHAPPNATYWAALPAGTGGLVVYELPSPFGGNLPNLDQSGKVITLTHKLAAPYELIYQGLTAWVLQPVVTTTQLAAPVGLALTPGAAGTRTFAYKVTAADGTYEESEASATVLNGACADPTPAAPNHLTWTPVTGAVEYYVYQDPFKNGTFGFLGTATGIAEFFDTGQIADFTLTPPVARALFAGAGEYPHVSATYQQRRFFAQTVNNPDAVWASRTGFRANFGISSPLQDDDSLTFRLAGNNNNPVQFLFGLKALIALTGGGEWQIGNPQAPLSPSNLGADQQTYVGAADVRPVLIGNAVLYVQARGSTLRDLQFEQQVEGLAGRDLTTYAAHLVDNFQLEELAYQLTPHSIVWGCRSDGVLVGVTYLREQEILAWHRHDTGAAGRFEHVCVVPETAEDAVYCIVRRTIGGGFVRYIERLESRQVVNLAADAFFVDAGLTYSGTPANTIAGLGHLNGQVVAVVGDGAVVFNGDPAATNVADFTVAGGTLPVALPAKYSTIHAGLPIRFAEIETLDLDVQGQAVRDKKKRVGSVTLLVQESVRTFQVGPDSAHLASYVLQPWQAAGEIVTEPLECRLESTYGDNGRVFLRHTDPLPLTILGIIPNVELGG